MQFQFVSLQTKLLLRLLKEMVSQYVVVSLFLQANVCVFYYVFLSHLIEKRLQLFVILNLLGMLRVQHDFMSYLCF